MPSASVPGEVYDRLYPHHVEVCAVSQIRPLDAPFGGSAGHAAMYLSGVCPVRDAPIPLLETCEGGVGTGISVNKMFRNVNWVAIPGRGLFIDGGVADGERLTHQHREDVVRETLDLGLFRGIQVHDDVLAARPAEMSVEEFVARESLGTDYALRHGRTVFCAKLPVTKPMLEEIIAYLNARNEKYASDGVDYQWSGYHDNCTHTIVNALANAGMWRRKSINEVKLRQLFHLAVPANEFVNLAILANDYPSDDFGRVRRDELRLEGLVRRGWLPGRHGGLIEIIGVADPNDLYDTGFKIFVLQSFLLQQKTRQAQRMLADPRYTDLESNLLEFKRRYEAALVDNARRADHEELSRYDTYIRRQLEDVERKLEELTD